MANQVTLDCVNNVCQTCSVIQKESYVQVVNACIQKSPIWQEFIIRKLIQPIQNVEDPEFSGYVNDIGDGAGPKISLNMLETTTSALKLTAFVFSSDILNQLLERLK